jgi:K+-transporting ATPase ATPase A chain
MTSQGTFQIILYLVVLLLLVAPLGWYMACVYENKSCGLNTFGRRFENFLYRICGIDPQHEMNWKNYLFAMLIFNFAGIVFVYLIQRLQGILPLNPQGFSGVEPALAFNTAASFTTNTDWQAYSGESSLSYLTQMLALTVQNFLSAATGMAIVVALIRGITRQETVNLGNFWTDVVRGTLYILLPLSLIFSFVLVAEGVTQNFKADQKVELIQPIQYQAQVQDTTGQPVVDAQGKPVMETKTLTEQMIPMGPVASQIAIKQLGTNGGGFFNVNSAHPFENPTPLTNFLEMLAILLIPAALCHMFGVMAKEARQGWVILLAMLLMLMPMIYGVTVAEQHGNPALTLLNIDPVPQVGLYPGGNMEGKETRFGIVNSAIWTAATTATGNGSVNSMLDSYIPLGGMLPLWLIQLGEVVFGGAGTGLSGMLIFVLMTVFVAGLMVGRTPEYLGKKIEPYEMKMTSSVILIMPMVVLLTTAVTLVTHWGTDSIANPGAHGFTEILYAFSSMTNNNGSAFAGLNANTNYYNILGGIAILIGRYWMVLPTLAIAGSLARKKIIPSGSGTLPTNNFMFIILLIAVVIVVGALTFLPSLALGPLVEQLMLWDRYGK